MVLVYRKMISIISDAGHRVVAHDLVGFGGSDKPARLEDYTYDRHVEWIGAALFDALDLRAVTPVDQDWGALIGLRPAAEHPARVSRIVAANGGLPTGDQTLSEAFFRWQTFAQETREFDVGRVIQNGCVTPLTPEVRAAYDAPFPDDSYKAGARAFPSLVPTSPDDRRPRQPPGVGGPLPLGAAASHHLQRLGPITRGGERARSSCPEPVGNRTPPSPAPVTSSRRTGARSWLQSWWTSSPAPTEPRRDERHPVSSESG